MLVADQDNYQFTDPNVQDIFRYARMAVGGGVSKLKTLEMKGKSKVDLNGSLIDCTVDIKFLGPDYYLRVDSTATDSKLAVPSPPVPSNCFVYQPAPRATAFQAMRFIGSPG
jgi:hypothetical protein